jgi:hypothetical protein
MPPRSSFRTMYPRQGQVIRHRCGRVEFTRDEKYFMYIRQGVAMKKKLPLFLIFATIIGIVSFSHAGVGQSAVITLVFPYGARSSAMGEVGTALADDASVLYFNPAGLDVPNDRFIGGCGTITISSGGKSGILRLLRSGASAMMAFSGCRRLISHPFSSSHLKSLFRILSSEAIFLSRNHSWSLGAARYSLYAFRNSSSSS